MENPPSTITDCFRSVRNYSALSLYFL